MKERGRIVSINISTKKGIKKSPIQKATVEANLGIIGDAHASSSWHRQISLLAIESIKKMRHKGLDVEPGDFAENLTTEGIDLVSLPLGTRLKIGNSVELQVTQKGKVCHTRCAIYYQTGDCIMPREGIFVKVLKGGVIQIGDPIEVMGND